MLTTVAKDSVTFTLKEADLTGKKVGDKLKTPKRDVPCSDGLQWWIEWYPAGDRETAKGHVSVFLWINKPVKAKFTLAVDGTLISETDTDEFEDAPQGSGWSNYAPHEVIRPFFRDGKLTITCSAEFTSSIQSIPATPAVYEVFDHTPPDFDLIIDSKRIPVHKNYLSLITPVYYTMFESGNFCESKSGETVITDFDYDVVKTAIDYYYGRELKLLSAKTYIGVLFFADKMEMKKITTDWENLIPSNLSEATFCDFLQYADKLEKKALLDECYSYFKTHQDEITVMNNFVKLPPPFVVKFLKAAFGLESDDQVLRHAHIYDIGFLMDYFDEGYLKDLSIENFSSAVSYAWEFSRENLQSACAKFFNNNIEMATDDAFANLPDETIGSVLRLAAKRKRDAEAEHSAEVTAKKANLGVPT